MNRVYIMNFGEALEALKKGAHVARNGWNGKGMFLYYVNGSVVQSDKFRDAAAKAIDKANEIEGKLSTPPSHRTINPHIDMKAADGSIVVGWLAS